MFFDILNNTLYNKKTDSKTINEHEAEFSSFMINRWYSMHSNDACQIINVTTNKFCTLFENKSQTYKMFLHMLPKLTRKRINYIKKVKSNNDEDDDSDSQTSLLAGQLELSKREINNYIQYEQEHRPTSTNKKSD